MHDIEAVSHVMVWILAHLYIRPFIYLIVCLSVSAHRLQVVIACKFQFLC